jgi:hypothetical protein
MLEALLFLSSGIDLISAIALIMFCLEIFSINLYCNILCKLEIIDHNICKSLQNIKKIKLYALLYWGQYFKIKIVTIKKTVIFSYICVTKKSRTLEWVATCNNKQGAKKISQFWKKC